MEVKHLNLYLQGSTYRWVSILCIFFLSFFLAGSGFSQTIIRGSAPQYAGASISILSYQNFITYSTRKLTSAVIEEDGTFELTLDGPHPNALILDVQFIQFAFYATNGGEYKILLENLVTLPSLPLWLIVERPDNDLNTAIAVFDDSLVALSDDYYPYIVKGIKVMEVDSMLDALGDYSTRNAASYMGTHVRYKLALVKQITHKRKISQFEKEFIIDSPVREDHLAYMQFITQYFSNYLSTLGAKSGGSALVNLINMQKDVGGVLEMLKKDKRLANDTLRELVLLNGLYELYNSPRYDQQMVLDLLDSLAVKTKISIHVDLANEIRSSLSYLRKGSKAPAFELPDSEGEMIKLSDFEGKFVYLSFWTSTCSSCGEELGVLFDLFKKYGDEVAFISISLGKLQGNINNETAGKGPDKSRMYFLVAKEDEELRAAYKVQSVPMYLLIDREGKIVKAPAAPPSGNIEKMFGSVLLGKKKNATIGDPGGN